MLTVLLGGARSGKSSAAIRLARESAGDVCFVATSPRIGGDDEIDARIAAHRAERPATWQTIETETDLAGAITATGDAFVIVDCLTVWLGNLVRVRWSMVARFFVPGMAVIASFRKACLCHLSSFGHMSSTSSQTF